MSLSLAEYLSGKFLPWINFRLFLKLLLVAIFTAQPCPRYIPGANVLSLCTIYLPTRVMALLRYFQTLLRRGGLPDPSGAAAVEEANAAVCTEETQK